MAGKRKAMGRGLDVLIKDGATTKRSASESGNADAAGEVRRVPEKQIQVGRFQPRRAFDGEALSDLVRSVQEHGVLQPLLVREVEDKFELIAGERRLRAARSAGLSEMPVIVLDASDEKALEIALIENLQREDLNPIEEAEGYAQLAKEFGLTQEDISKRVGKGRTTIANSLRLLELPESIRRHVAEGLLSAGHAKVLLGVSSNKEKELLAKRAIKEGLSVRALEKLVKRLGRIPKKPRAEKSDLPKEYLNSLTDELHHYFGTGIRVTPTRTLANGRKVKGSLEIDFHNNDDLDRILSLVGFTTEL